MPVTGQCMKACYFQKRRTERALYPSPENKKFDESHSALATFLCKSRKNGRLVARRMASKCRKQITYVLLKSWKIVVVKLRLHCYRYCIPRLFFDSTRIDPLSYYVNLFLLYACTLRYATY